MAFKTDIASASSLRLNAVPVGALVALCDFQRKAQFALARFEGWRDGNGQPVSAPARIKSMPADWTMLFTVFEQPKEEGGEVTETGLVLVKDPAGFGAMFREVTTGEGEAATKTLRRVTAYAAPDVLAEITKAKEAAKAAKAEKAAKEAAEQAATVTEENATEGTEETEAAPADDVTAE